MLFDRIANRPVAPVHRCDHRATLLRGRGGGKGDKTREKAVPSASEVSPRQETLWALKRAAIGSKPGHARPTTPSRKSAPRTKLDPSCFSRSRGRRPLS